MYELNILTPIECYLYRALYSIRRRTMCHRLNDGLDEPDAAMLTS